MFKPGDKVIRTGPDYQGAKHGSKYTVYTVSPSDYFVTLTGLSGEYDGDRFTLAPEENDCKELPAEVQEVLNAVATYTEGGRLGPVIRAYDAYRRSQGPPTPTREEVIREAIQASCGGDGYREIAAHIDKALKEAGL